MTALAADRDTPQMGDDAVIDLISIPIAASTHIYRGSIVCVNISGYGVPASAALGLVAVGIALENVNNTGSAGAKSVNVRRGTFRLGNSSSTGALTVADVGKPCYLVDDQTVSRIDSLGTRSLAGRVINVDSTGVWVEIGADPDPTIRDILVLAAADLSSTGQNLLVAMSTSGTVDVASAAGQDCVGVLQNAPASGAVAIVRISGKTRVYASGSINPGVLLATTSAGKTKAAVAASVNTTDASSATDAVLGSFVMGRALTAGTTDTLHSMLLQPIGAIPTTAA